MLNWNLAEVLDSLLHVNIAEYQTASKMAAMMVMLIPDFVQHFLGNPVIMC